MAVVRTPSDVWRAVNKRAQLEREQAWDEDHRAEIEAEVDRVLETFNAIDWSDATSASFRHSNVCYRELVNGTVQITFTVMDMHVPKQRCDTTSLLHRLMAQRFASGGWTLESLALGVFGGCLHVALTSTTPLHQKH